jgi:hypothetical protein
MGLGATISPRKGPGPMGIPCIFPADQGIQLETSSHLTAPSATLPNVRRPQPSDRCPGKSMRSRHRLLFRVRRDGDKIIGRIEPGGRDGSALVDR